MRREREEGGDGEKRLWEGGLCCIPLLAGTVAL